VATVFNGKKDITDAPKEEGKDDGINCSSSDEDT